MIAVMACIEEQVSEPGDEMADHAKKDQPVMAFSEFNVSGSKIGASIQRETLST